MKKGIIIFVVALILLFIAAACKSTQNCPAYGQNVQVETVAKTV